MERENSQRMIPRRRGNDQKNIHMRRRKHRKHRFLKVLVVILTVIVMWKLIGNVGSWVRQWQLDEEYGVCTKYVYS